jgi:hypothetical protein
MLMFNRAASKQAISYIKRFAEDMYKSMGVRFLFLTALESPEGTIETGVMDFNDSIGGGTSYIAANPTWNMEGIDIESWNAHCRDYYNAEQGAPVHHKKLPRKHLMFEENEYGEPILPNPLEVPKRQNGRTWRQAVVRGFLSRHYGMWHTPRVALSDSSCLRTCFWEIQSNTMEKLPARG